MSQNQKPEEQDAHVVTPPDHIFSKKHVIDASMLSNGTRFNIYERTEYPLEGGIYVYYKGLPYPKKGFPFPDAIWMNDVMKRISVFFLRSFGNKDMALPALAYAILPYRMKLRTAERVLSNYARVGVWMLQSAFLVDERYSDACRSIHKLVNEFLIEAGIDFNTARDVSKVITTMFEYDDSYRYRLEDIMSEANKERLVKQPIREFRRLANIFKEREKFGDMIGKIDGIVFLGTLALMHPRIRKAWKRAWKNLSFEQFMNMQLDDADRYHVLIRGDYDFFGKGIENRMRRYTMMHTTSQCHGAMVLSGGYCSKCKEKCKTNFNPPPTVEIKK